MKRFVLFLLLALSVSVSGFGQTIRNTNHSAVAKIDHDGTVRNSNNSTLGKVESDGTVRDSNNHTIGYAKGVPMKYAAVFFFFGCF